MRRLNLKAQVQFVIILSSFLIHYSKVENGKILVLGPQKSSQGATNKTHRPEGEKPL